jgi:hypothetical protein
VTEPRQDVRDADRATMIHTEHPEWSLERCLTEARFELSWGEE